MDLILSILEAASYLAALFGGLTAVYLALFTFEQEDGVLHDRLEELWILIDDQKQARLQQLETFLLRVSALCSEWLDFLFGVRLLSSWSIAVSVTLSLLSLVFSTGWYLVVSRAPSFLVVTYLLFALWLVCLFGSLLFLRAIPPGRSPSAKFLAIYSSICLLVGPLVVSFAAFQALRYLEVEHLYHESLRHLPIALGVGTYLGVATDLASIVVVRRAFRSTQETGNFWSNPIASCVILILAALLPGAIVWEFSPRESSLGGTFLVVLGSNLPSLGMAVLLVATTAVLMSGRFVFGLLSRSVYSSVRYRVVQNKKLLWGVALFLLIYPLSALFRMIEVATRALLHSGP